MKGQVFGDEQRACYEAGDASMTSWSSRIGFGAVEKMRAATSSKINPQSHQNTEAETPAALSAERWSHMTTTQEARNRILQIARTAARRGQDHFANNSWSVSMWKLRCPSSSWQIWAKTARNTGSWVPSCNALKCLLAIISGRSKTSKIGRAHV